MLGISVPTMLGHIHLVWHFALSFAPDGDLSAFTDEEIADAAMWEGDCNALRNALRNTCFIDPDGFIHNWYNYAGKYVEQEEHKRIGNRERQRRFRQRHKGKSDDDTVTESNALRNAPVTARNAPTRPNHTKPINTTRAVPNYTPDFLAFYSAYPKHENKKAAFDLWEKIDPDAEMVAVIMAAVERQKQGRKWIEGYANAPDVWLRGAKWEDEPEPMREVGSTTSNGYRSQAEINQLKRNPDGTPKWVG